MITPEIQQYVQSQIEEAAKKGQISVSKVPYHTHNNVDSPKLPLTSTEAGVSSIVAGTNVTISPTGGTGAVTINSSSSSAVSSVTGSGSGINVTPTTGAVVISNTGVTSNIAGTGIGVSGSTGAVTISNDGVTSLIAGTNITLSGSTGAVTVSASGGGGGISITSGFSGKVMSDASTTQTIAHGLGTTPTYVRISYTMGGSSSDIGVGNGTFDGTNQRFAFAYSLPGSESNSAANSGSIISMLDNGSNGQNAVLTVDATNLYLAWTKRNSGLGGQALFFIWEASTL